MLKFEWDELKRRLNLKSHGVDFEEAKQAFEDAHAMEALDERFEYGEERWLVIGAAATKLLAVVYVERDGATRIISGRPATKQEIKAYAEQSDR